MKYTVEIIRMVPTAADLGVVETVHFAYTATAGVHSATEPGSVTLDAPPKGFTPAEQLTQAQVQGWVLAAIGKKRLAAIKDRLKLRIAAAKATPPNVAMPWALPAIVVDQFAKGAKK